MSRSPIPTPVAISASRLETAGRWCAAAGAVGVVQGAAMLAWGPQVDDTRYSYPLTSSGFAAAQVSFFLQHLPLVFAVAVLARAVSARESKVGRIALLGVVIGMAGLTAMELIAISAANVAADSSRAALVNSLYGPPVILAGVGTLVGGIALLRRRALDRAVTVSLIAIGAWSFVGLTPALGSGNYVAGRLAIMVWMALFAALGWGMTRTRAPSGTVTA